jgi:hypothetical protein
VGRNPRLAGWLPVRMARMFLLPNELRRSSDRVEAAVLAVLVAAFVTAAVVAALLFAYLCRSGEAAAVAGPRPALAVLTSPGAAGKVFPQQATARATWRLSDGTERSGILTTSIAPSIYGLPAGASVRVWLDRAGDPQPPPSGPDGMFIGAALAGLAITGVAAAVLVYGYRLCRRVLDRHRLAIWSSAWAVTGPRWTRHQ